MSDLVSNFLDRAVIERERTLAWTVLV